ncbi:CDP-glucose 4,6-dehydratase [Chloroflexota bacterium]
MTKVRAFNNIYRGKRVLVTGHTGFKGSWLSIWLRELGADVVGYSLEPPSTPNNFTTSFLENHLTHIHGDVRNLDQLQTVFNKYEPEIVFHLAAQSIVRLSYQEPKLTFDSNVGGTINVLEAVRLTPSVRVVVNVTSDKCYENREWIWGYRECDPIGGHDPYSASKGAAEITFNAYLRSFFNEHRTIGAASVRAGNAIGGGDWGLDRIIPDCIRALLQGEAIGIHHPLATRPWQHVLEPLSGYLWLGALLWNVPAKYSGAWNFGPSDETTYTVSEVVGRLIQLWGSGSYKDVSVNQKNAVHEASFLKLCCDKAHTYLHWYPIYSCGKALDLTVNWYKHYYQEQEVKDMYNFCVDQIKEYLSTAAKQGLAWTEIK